MFKKISDALKHVTYEYILELNEYYSLIIL